MNVHHHHQSAALNSRRTQGFPILSCLVLVIKPPAGRADPVTLILRCTLRKVGVYDLFCADHKMGSREHRYGGAY